MIFYILSVVVVLKLYFLTRYFSKRERKSCFTQGNYDKVLEYTQWKLRTSKIGKVLVEHYRVEISPEKELLFKKDETNYTVFKVNRDDGIILLAVKHPDSLKRKADNAFCELLKRAIFHPVASPKEELN